MSDTPSSERRSPSADLFERTVKRMLDTPPQQHKPKGKPPKRAKPRQLCEKPA